MKKEDHYHYILTDAKYIINGQDVLSAGDGDYIVADETGHSMTLGCDSGGISIGLYEEQDLSRISAAAKYYNTLEIFSKNEVLIDRAVDQTLTILKFGDNQIEVLTTLFHLQMWDDDRGFVDFT